MTKGEKIRMALMHENMSIAKLAKAMGTSPQNFGHKLKIGTVNDEDMEAIANILHCTWVSELRFDDGTVISLRDQPAAKTSSVKYARLEET